MRHSRFGYITFLLLFLISMLYLNISLKEFKINSVTNKIDHAGILNVSVNKKTHCLGNVADVGCINSSRTSNCNTPTFPHPSGVNITAESSTVICPGDSVILIASGNNYLYEWSTHATTKSITISAGGIYYVKATDINSGCSFYSNIINVSIRSLNSDINIDGLVNSSDYNLLIQRFGNYCNSCPEDLKRDSLINTNDFLLLLGDYNKTCQ